MIEKVRAIKTKYIDCVIVVPAGPYLLEVAGRALVRTDIFLARVTLQTLLHVTVERMWL